MTPDAWDGALSRLASPAPLMQSWGYGETQAREGWEVERVELDGGARATVLVQGLGPVRWAYVPRGPVPCTPEAVDGLVGWARLRSVARLRIEPEAAAGFGELLRQRGFQPAAHVQPRTTLIVPLASEDEMMASFKPKHRYNVRLALRRGVTVEEGDDASELRRQSVATGDRHGISIASLEAYRNRLELLPWCRVYVARQDGDALAAIMVARFDGRAYYLFGGTSGARRELMPMYAAQWWAMKEAQRAGCRDYDMWGMPPAPDRSHPWFGLWQFKIGFGGELVKLAGGWELVLSPLGSRISDAASLVKRGLTRLRG